MHQCRFAEAVAIIEALNVNPDKVVYPELESYWGKKFNDSIQKQRYHFAEMICAFSNFNKSEDNFYCYFGKVIDILMALKGWLYDQLEQSSGISRKSLAAYRDGKPLRFDSALKIARGFDVPISMFILPAELKKQQE